MFGSEFREDLVHQVVVAYRNAGRAGTKAQKIALGMSRHDQEVKKQKGGGARHGDYRAPIFVGGGARSRRKPRSFAQKVNRKMYRGAMRSILSELNRQGRLTVVESFGVDAAEDQGPDRASSTSSKSPAASLIVTENASENAVPGRAQRAVRATSSTCTALDPVALVGADTSS